MILHCTVGFSKENCENHFTPILTDKGICYSYNAKDFDKMLKNLTYKEHFLSIFGNPYHIQEELEEKKLGTGFKMFLIL